MGTLVFIFGDSIGQGIWDPEGGWAGRLSRFLMERVVSATDPYFITYNLSVSGNTSTDVLSRFEDETERRIANRPERNIIVIFAIGTNDAKFWHDKTPQTSPETFRQNLKALAAAARKFTDKIVFVGLTAVDESKTAPVPPPARPGSFYRNQYLREYDGIVKAIAAEKDILFADVLPKFSKGDYLPLLDSDDGLHPNSAGHQKIFEIVRDFLLERKII